MKNPYIGRKVKNLPRLALNPYEVSNCLFYIYCGSNIPLVYHTMKKLKEDYGEYYVENIEVAMSVTDIYVKE